jgi:tetratricopeptide (TPR) repeat protein
MASSSSTAASANQLKTHSREAVLLVTLLLLLLLIIFTAFVTRMYHKKYHVLADEWFARGEASFQAGDAAAALNDYRNAMIYSPANPNFQFHLARSLAGTGRNDEARAYLLNLLSESPGSGQINLELARIAARGGPKSMPDALRYYHAAIYGEWETDPIGMRWQIRREFCEYLLNNNAMNQAEAEIIALADNTSPDNLEEQKTAGNLLLRARLWSRALQQFQTVLATDPNDQVALVGAGTAAFQLAQHPQAAGYFNRLPPQLREDPSVAGMVDTSNNIVLADPFLPGLSAEERAKRTANAVAIAEARATACAKETGEALHVTAPASPLQKAVAPSDATHADWSERNLRAHPERIDAAMAAAFDMENAAANQCGEAAGLDYALWLLGRGRQGGLR